MGGCYGVGIAKRYLWIVLVGGCFCVVDVIHLESRMVITKEI